MGHKFEGNVKMSRNVISPVNVEEDIFLKEFERLREFERLEEAFQEGKASMATRMGVACKSGEYGENTPSSDVITVSTETTSSTGETNYYVRAPMTPITEESASSIEEAKCETKKQGKNSVEGKSVDQINSNQSKDDNCLLFKPSQAIADVEVIQKSPIKKKTIKTPRR